MAPVLVFPSPADEDAGVCVDEAAELALVSVGVAAAITVSQIDRVTSYGKS